MTVWFRSSPLFMATKASGSCVAPPSTPCCGCCLGALPSCTEGFTSGDPASPSGRRDPCCFLPPVPAAFSGAFSLSLLASACCLPSSFFVRWPPLLFSLPLCLLVCCLVPVASPRVVGVGVVLVFWWGCSCLVCCLFIGGLVG